MLARLLLGLVIVTLLACGDNPRAPVEDRQARSSSTAREYRVQGGDTLYSIAFRYGLDYRKVAAANHIARPYTIFPGQKLLLQEAPVPVVAARHPVGKSSGRPAPSAPAKTPAASPPPIAASVAKSHARKAPLPATVSRWRWPTTGKVTRRYSSTVHKGIDIGGDRGDAIRAVADGRVVYAGTGIVGFGELLIVKHSDVYLSAYGHNDKLLVAEGDNVKAGQKIALKGSTGTDTVKLHFEIRREGKPVDPLKILPAR